MAVTVLLVSNDSAHRAVFTDALHEVPEIHVVGFADRTSDVVDVVSRYRPDVIVLDDTMEPDSASDVARLLLADDPAAALVLWTDRETSETLSEALDVGMRAVVTWPLTVPDVTAKIVAAAEWSQRLRLDHAGPGTSAVAGTMVAVFGAKGGVGTSTVAIQLARLASGPVQGVVLVDFDLAAGDLASLLDLSNQRSVLDLAPVADHLNARYLADALYAHPSGIRVLAAPAESERAEELTEPIARRVLGALRAHFPVVVVDCGSRLDDANAVALEIADQALLVVTPDVPCLLAARRHLATFSRLSIRSDDSVLAVVNRQSKRSEFQVPSVHRTLGIPVANTAIPDRDGAFHAAIGEGDPRRVEDRAVVGALRRLGRQLNLVRADGPEAPRPGPPSPQGPGQRTRSRWPARRSATPPPYVASGTPP